MAYRNRSLPASVAGCLAAALNLSAAWADSAGEALPTPLTDRFSPHSAPALSPRNQANTPAHRTKSTPQPSAMTHYVGTCVDDMSAQSLRTLIATANSGDTIDFSQLPMSCSTITLDHAQVPPFIEVLQDSLSFVGPANRELTIEGNHYYQSSMFRHRGSGTLSVSNLTLSHGKYISADKAKGGCIYTLGNLDLTNSTVSHCGVTGTGSGASYGGGIFVKGNLSIAHSRIVDNGAYNIGDSNGRGGGIYVVGALDVTDSLVANNEAHNNAYSPGFGAGNTGGVYARGTVSISRSTISANKAWFHGGIAIGGVATITNSTVSGNLAIVNGGGIWTSQALTLVNSTVAFNHLAQGNDAAGIRALGQTLTIESSIVAANFNTLALQNIDISGGAATVVLGSHNLVTASTLPLPPDTIVACPQLEPLLANGGPTPTHALRHTSAAMNNGSAGTLLVDQRGLDRVFGFSADIGAFEWHDEAEERLFAGTFDGVCDQ